MIGSETSREAYGELLLDLSVARKDVEFKIRGNTFAVIESNATGEVYFQPNTRDVVKIDLRRYRKIKFPFERFYINHAAQPGKSVRIMFGQMGVSDVQPISVSQVINTDYSVADLATQGKAEEINDRITQANVYLSTMQGPISGTIKANLTSLTGALKTVDTDELITRIVNSAGAEIDPATNSAVINVETAVGGVETAVDTLAGGTSIGALGSGQTLASVNASCINIKGSIDTMKAGSTLAILGGGQTTAQASFDNIEDALIPTAPQAHGLDAAGANAYTTIVTAGSEKHHISISLQGANDAIVSINSGTTETFFIPFGSNMVFDSVLIANGATIQGKNAIADSNYVNLAVTVW